METKTLEKNVICHCTETTIEDIKTLYDSGFDNLEKISQMTGACSGCGACEDSIMTLIAELKD
jgi:bacterioferritin-associated ferredoxin